MGFRCAWLAVAAAASVVSAPTAGTAQTVTSLRDAAALNAASAVPVRVIRGMRGEGVRKRLATAPKARFVTGGAVVAAGTGASPANSPANAAKAPAPKPAPDVWSEAEIRAAQAECTAALKGVHGVMVPEPPIKNGVCGSPATYKVLSIGKRPAVVLDPPAILSCSMISTLNTWLKKDLQPLARANLGGPIVKIITMSSYSCRNAYGRKTTRLSEHGLANALDIAGFETNKAGPTLVLNTWGPTEREIRTLAAKAERKRKAAAKKAAQQSKTASAGSTGGESGPVLTPAGAPGLVIQMPGPEQAGSAGTLGLAPPTRLGGPKAQTTRNEAGQAPKSASMPDLISRQTQFIRNAHATACRRFRTTLGPEANRAHKNHFHVDMANRRNGSAYCE